MGRFLGNSLTGNEIMKFSVLGFRSDIRIELQAPVAVPAVDLNLILVKLSFHYV